MRAVGSGKVSAAVVLALVTAAGCGADQGAADKPAPSATGPETTAGVPKSPSATANQLADACALPPDVLRRAGLEPETRRPNDQPGWRICSWNSADDQPFMTAELYLTTVGYPELLANSRYDRFVPTQVGGRQEATYFRKIGDVGDECYIAWSTATGTAWAGIHAFLSGTSDWSDPCQYVQGWADAAYPVVSR